jgi:hypothetical protein
MRAAGGRVIGVVFDLAPASPTGSAPGKLNLPEPLHLGLELDAESVEHAPASLGHQGEHVGGARITGVLDEIRVLG